MYADDTSLLVSSSDPLCLQNNLNLNMCKTASWYQKNPLTINISKTKLMLFGTPQNLSKYQNICLIYDGETIERVGNFRYLGIVFDSRMIDLIASNVSKRCGVIRHVKHYIFQIISSKKKNNNNNNLLILLSCHILIIVVKFGPTARLLCQASCKFFWTTLPELFSLLISELILFLWCLLSNGSN